MNYKSRISISVFVSALGHILITIKIFIWRKTNHEESSKNIPYLKEPWPIFIITKSNKISIGPIIDVSNFAPGIILEMDFAFFNVKIIRIFTSTFVTICSATSYPFGLLPRSKHLTLDIPNLLATLLNNHDKKTAFIWLDVDGPLVIYSEFIWTCCNMNIIVQITGDNTYSLNGKIEIPNNTLDNITRDIIMKSSHKKKLQCSAYQYAICISQ